MCRIFADASLSFEIRHSAASAIVVQGRRDLLVFLRPYGDLLARMLAAVPDSIDIALAAVGTPMLPDPSRECQKWKGLADEGLRTLVDVMLIPAMLYPVELQDSEDVEIIRQIARPAGLAAALLDASARVLEFTSSVHSGERTLAAVGSVHAVHFCVLLAAFNPDVHALRASVVASGLIEVFVGAASAATFAIWATAMLPKSRAWHVQAT